MDWNSNIFWNVVSFIGGLIITSIFFVLSLKKRKLSYSKTTTPIIVKKTSKVSDLVITYKGKNIDDLSSSYIQIKNIGNETLEEKDFPELSKLRIVTDGEFFINTVDELEITSSNKSIKIYPLLVSIHEIQLHFDYLDPKDTIYCNVFHTHNIDVLGHIKHGKLINNTQLEKLNRYKKNLNKLFPILVLIYTVICIKILLYFNLF